MPKTSRNKKSKSENILELLYRLKDKEFLLDFEKDLQRRQGGDVFKSVFKLFKGFVEKELPIERIPSDSELAKLLKQNEVQFNTTRRDFYKRILNFTGRVVTKKQDWYEELLVILSEVDALWEIDLRDQAEMRFIDTYKVYPTNENFQNKREYNYGLSKMAYYGMIFFCWKSYLGIEDTHKEFFKKEQFQLIQHIESIARQFDVGKPLYGSNEHWPLNQAMFRFHNLLATISKQKLQFTTAIEHLKTQEKYYNQLAAAYHFREEYGKRIFRFFSDNEPKEAAEIETAFYFYLKLEAFRLSVLDGDVFQAQDILHELYKKLNETYDKTRNNWAALIFFLKSELDQATYAVPFSAKTIEERAKLFSASFLASKNEIKSLLLRTEVNNLTFEFISSPEIPLFETYDSDIRDLENRLKGVTEVRIDLLLLKLLICFEGQRYDKIQETVRSLNVAMAESEKTTKFMKQFVIRFSKLKFQNLHGINQVISEMFQAIEPLRNKESYLDNLIVFWMKQFTIRGAKKT